MSRKARGSALSATSAAVHDPLMNPLKEPEPDYDAPPPKPRLGFGADRLLQFMAADAEPEKEDEMFRKPSFTMFKPTIDKEEEGELFRDVEDDSLIRAVERAEGIKAPKEVPQMDSFVEEPSSIDAANAVKNISLDGDDSGSRNDFGAVLAGTSFENTSSLDTDLFQGAATSGAAASGTSTSKDDDDLFSVLNKDSGDTDAGFSISDYISKQKAEQSSGGGGLFD